MIPVKSISQLQPFQNQNESLAQFENFNVDSSEIGLTRYNISAENFENPLFAGNLNDNDLLIEVSYCIDKTHNVYVPRKFDLSNYLRYIENALSVLNNGILGVYLTESKADNLYVKKRGDTMYGPLTVSLTDSDTTSIEAPILIDDQRGEHAVGRGYIEIKGKKEVGIKISNNDKTNSIVLNGNTPSLIVNGIFEANGESNKVSIKKPLTVTGNTTIDGTLETSATTITGTLTVSDTITAENNITCANLDASTITGGSLVITSILSANADVISLKKNTSIDGTLTMSGSTLHINNNSAAIKFGTTTVDKATLAFNSEKEAFTMSRLIIAPATSDKDIIGKAAVTVDSDLTGRNFALTVEGNAQYEGSILGNEAIRGSKLVTKDFEANKITALNSDGDGGFEQTIGIANLTAKRACWA